MGDFESVLCIIMQHNYMEFNCSVLSILSMCSKRLSMICPRLIPLTFTAHIQDFMCHKLNIDMKTCKQICQVMFSYKCLLSGSACLAVFLGTQYEWSDIDLDFFNVNLGLNDINAILQEVENIINENSSKKVCLTQSRDIDNYGIDKTFPTFASLIRIVPLSIENQENAKSYVETSHKNDEKSHHKASQIAGAICKSRKRLVVMELISNSNINNTTTWQSILDNFDMNICKIAWDGKSIRWAKLNPLIMKICMYKAYQAPSTNKSYRMRSRIQILHRVQKHKDRIDKYRSRGFTMIPIDDIPI